MKFNFFLLIYYLLNYLCTYFIFLWAWCSLPEQEDVGQFGKEPSLIRPRHISPFLISYQSTAGPFPRAGYTNEIMLVWCVFVTLVGRSHCWITASTPCPHLWNLRYISHRYSVSQASNAFLVLGGFKCILETFFFFAFKYSQPLKDSIQSPCKKIMQRLLVMHQVS